jgi:hypothetical protein
MALKSALGVADVITPTKYERDIAGDTDFSPFRNVYWRAQTFTIGVSGTNENFPLKSVKILCYRDGTPGIITAHIRAVDGAHKPTGADLSIGTTDGDTLTNISPGEWREINMSAVTLLANTEYALCMSAVGVPDTQLVDWRCTGVSNYAGGSYFNSGDSGVTWNSAAVDFMFEIWGNKTTLGSVPTSLVTLGGY